MVSSTFRDLPGIPLELPEAKTAEATRSAGVEIRIDREGVVRLEGRIVGAADLEERLAAALDAAARELFDGGLLGGSARLDHAAHLDRPSAFPAPTRVEPWRLAPPAPPAIGALPDRLPRAA